MATIMQSLPSDKESIDYQDCHGVENEQERDQDLLSPVSAAQLSSNPLQHLDQQSAGSMASLLDADDFTGSVVGRYVPRVSGDCTHTLVVAAVIQHAVWYLCSCWENAVQHMPPRQQQQRNQSSRRKRLSYHMHLSYTASRGCGRHAARATHVRCCSACAAHVHVSLLITCWCVVVCRSTCSMMSSLCAWSCWAGRMRPSWWGCCGSWTAALQRCQAAQRWCASTHTRHMKTWTLLFMLCSCGTSRYAGRPCCATDMPGAGRG
jgi:hypothetical protein